MGVTTVRVELDVKAELDRLQGLVQAETGRRLSQSELLARLVRFAQRRPDQFVADAQKEWVPPNAKELRRLFSRVRDWGVAIDVDRIDDTLYGGSTG